MNMLQADTACDDLVSEMKHTSQRLLSELDHQLHVDGIEWIEQLPSRKRLDLSLYYKECLINILRHSNASSCRTELRGQADQVCIEICDNGELINDVPPSLQRRADLLGAKIHYRVTTDGENSITITVKTGSMLFRVCRFNKQKAI